MGGGLSIDYALTHPNHVEALILVGSDPAGLELEAPWPDELLRAILKPLLKPGTLIASPSSICGYGSTAMDGRRNEVDSQARCKAYAMAKLVIEHERKRHRHACPQVRGGDRPRERLHELSNASANCHRRK